jgi:predicted nucleic-acid-binding protein
MKSLDTNVPVRYYAQDDPVQSSVAMRLFVEEPKLFVPKTVLIEFWWVLTQAEKFRFPAAKVMAVFEHLLDLPNVEVEDEIAVSKAIEWCRAGLEFQDALHLASSEQCSAMLTFDDRRFARRVNRLGLQPPCRVPEPVNSAE